MSKPQFRIEIKRVSKTGEEIRTADQRAPRVFKPTSHNHKSHKIPIIICICFLIILLFLLVFIHIKRRDKPANPDPFTAQIRSSVKFPLYYPTKLPTGYHIKPGSVSKPQSNVVVFAALGPSKQKLYFSEEARDLYFNLSQYYIKFSDLKITNASNSIIAVGRVNKGYTEIASRANNSTWILSNTNAHIPLDQLTTMLKSIAKSS